MEVNERLERLRRRAELEQRLLATQPKGIPRAPDQSDAAAEQPGERSGARPPDPRTPISPMPPSAGQRIVPVFTAQPAGPSLPLNGAPAPDVRPVPGSSPLPDSLPVRPAASSAAPGSPPETEPSTMSIPPVLAGLSLAAAAAAARQTDPSVVRTAFVPEGGPLPVRPKRMTSPGAPAGNRSPVPGPSPVPPISGASPLPTLPAPASVPPSTPTGPATPEPDLLEESAGHGPDRVEVGGRATAVDDGRPSQLLSGPARAGGSEAATEPIVQLPEQIGPATADPLGVASPAPVSPQAPAPGADPAPVGPDDPAPGTGVTTHDGTAHAGTTAAGITAAGTTAAGTTAAGTTEEMTRGAGIPDTTSAGAVTTGAVTIPPGTAEVVTVPPGTAEVVTVPPGTVEVVTVPPGTVPPGTVPPGTTDAGPADAVAADVGVPDTMTAGAGTADPGGADAGLYDPVPLGAVEPVPLARMVYEVLAGLQPVLQRYPGLTVAVWPQHAPAVDPATAVVLTLDPVTGLQLRMPEPGRPRPEPAEPSASEPAASPAPTEAPRTMSVAAELASLLRDAELRPGGAD